MLTPIMAGLCLYVLLISGLLVDGEWSTVEMLHQQ